MKRSSIAMSRTNKLRSNSSRPRDGKRSRSFDAVLSLLVPVVINGVRVMASAEEAFLLDMRQKSRQGDASASELMAGYADLVAEQRQTCDTQMGAIVRRIVEPGSVNRQLELLRMARKFDRYNEKAYMKLEPWLVQKALDRLGDKQLSLEDQHTIVAATRTPHKVNWPDWWVVMK